MVDALPEGEEFRETADSVFRIVMEFDQIGHPLPGRIGINLAVGAHVQKRGHQIGVTPPSHVVLGGTEDVGVKINPCLPDIRLFPEVD